MAARSLLQRSLALPTWRSTLAHRGLLLVEGKDARKLVQGLVTSDVSLLDESGPQYTAFLAASGRVLFDAFLIGGTEGSVLVDVDTANISSLAKHLLKYKLRSKAKVRDISDEHSVLAVGGALPALGEASPCDGGAWIDPRLACVGARVIHRRDAALPAWLDAIPEADPALHALQLSVLGVPDGPRDLTGALPLESNIELLNGVSFAKGCYLGQELTARTHFRGVVRKRLLPVVDASRLGPAEEEGAAAEEEAAAAADLAALAMLPPPERRMAARLLDASPEHGSLGGGDPSALSVGTPAGEGEAEREGDGGEGEGEGAGLKLLNAKGKRAATLRSYNPVLGVGLALCRLEALGAAQSLAATEDAAPAGLPPLLPVRPSWWPEAIGAG